MARLRVIVNVLAWIVGVVVALVAGGYLYLVIASNRMIGAEVTVPVPVPDIRIPEGEPAAIARGTYLVDHVVGCRDCHGVDLGGKIALNNAVVATLWAPNLTAGAGSRTANFTGADWVRALRHGVGRSGRRLIMMPSEDFQNFSDDDLAAIAAVVKAAPAVDRAEQPHSYGPIGRLLLVRGDIRFAYDRIDHAHERAPVAMGATAEWGRVMAGACVGCHGQGYSGGAIPGADPSWPPARNLTPDATGLKAWSWADFRNAIRTGKRPDGAAIRSPMPWKAYAGMTDSDLEAIYLFLQSLEPRPFGGR